MIVINPYWVDSLEDEIMSRAFGVDISKYQSSQDGSKKTKL